MDIRTALDAIVTREAAITIAAPVAATIRKAHKYMAPQEATLPETPCFMNGWRLVSHKMGHGRGSVIETYVVNAQLFIEDADIEVAADIATAFHVAFVTDIEDGDITLGGAAKKYQFRDGDGASLVALQRAGRNYIGVNYFLEVLLTK